MKFLVPGRQSAFSGRAIFIEGRQVRHGTSMHLHAMEMLGCMYAAYHNIHASHTHVCDYDVMRVGTLPILARNTLDRSS